MTGVVAHKAEQGGGLLDEISSRLEDNEPVRRTLRGGGRLHVDRQLPFLCVYRAREEGGDAGTRRLVTGEAAYLVGPGAPEFEAQLLELVQVVARTQSRHFGGFLLLELWASPGGGKANDPTVPQVLPKFTIHAPATQAATPAIMAVDGDTRLFLMNGAPFVHQGNYAAFQRVRQGDDLRSNLHAGGRLKKADVSEQMLRIAERVRPRRDQPRTAKTPLTHASEPPSPTIGA